MKLSEEIARRRTFAIISHPDAGKTTLTEKLLLYGGSLHLAGSVSARKHQRATASDWMELEKKRGISISSTVLQFEYDGYYVNLLDTPGHKDFSEDTYRVLTAVDAAIMVIDAGKGIESQTRKLFEVCARRKIPIFTFINKLDRPARDPLDLLDELEKVLGIYSFAVNWPLGTGNEFQGVYDRITSQVSLFEKTLSGAYRAPVAITDLTDPMVRDRLSPELFKTTVDELDVLSMGSTFDSAAVLRGELTPVFFGSASNNFGIQMLLDSFLKYSSPPTAHKSQETLIQPDNENFSAFVFKIQANMDPKHRDRIAFARICSGKFERDMPVIHAQSGKRVRLSNSHKLFGQERETLNEAYAGDVVGLVGHSEFGIGDTLTTDPKIIYNEIPRFAPESFRYLHNVNAAQYKRFRQGVDQLLNEQVVQTFQLGKGGVQQIPLIAAVGPLQFEVVQYRLLSEYGVDSRFEAAPWTTIRWIVPGTDPEKISKAKLVSDATFATDINGFQAVLFANDWNVRYFTEKNPELPLQELPPARGLA